MIIWGESHKKGILGRGALSHPGVGRERPRQGADPGSQNPERGADSVLSGKALFLQGAIAGDREQSIRLCTIPTYISSTVLENLWYLFGGFSPCRWVKCMALVLFCYMCGFDWCL